jgi:4-amino-4-deoxy-L-arabinose transferase-like glycosyltransferase
MNIRTFLDSRGVVWILLIVITGIGFYLRLRHLGDLGFRDDEDITTLAVKGILEYGYPRFPTGMIYLRSGLFLYVLALSAHWLGVNEFALRLPAVLFSTATIPLAYMFCARLFNRSVGVLVAAVLSVSFWELEIARNVRMYAPFAFFYLLTVLAFYHYYIEGKGKWKIITTLLAFLTVTIHSLGFSLAFLFLFPLLFEERRRTTHLSLIVNFFLIAVFFFLWDEVMYHFMFLPAIENGFPPLPPDQYSTDTGPLFGIVLGFAEEIDAMFALPQLELLRQLYQVSFPVFFTFSIACLMIAAGLLFLDDKQKSIQKLLLLLIILCCYLQQFSLALPLFFVYLFFYYEGLTALRYRQTKLLLNIILLFFVFWLIFGLWFSPPNDLVASGQSTHFRQTLKLLLNFPKFNIVGVFLKERPVMSAIAGLGFLWAFHVAAQKTETRNWNALFLIFSFFVPLFITGSFRSQYENYRYIIHFDVFYLAFFVLGVTRWQTVAGVLMWNKSNNGFFREKMRFGSVSAPMMVNTLLLIVVMIIDLNPAKTWYATQLHYGDNKVFFGLLKLGHYGDNKTTTSFVKDHLQDEDIVIVIDAREIYNYLGKADYWIATEEQLEQTYQKDGKLWDLYVGARYVTDLEELRSIVEENSKHRVWFIASSQRLADPFEVKPEVAHYIEELANHIVYVGKDQDTMVYLLRKDRQ